MAALVDSGTTAGQRRAGPADIESPDPVATREAILVDVMGMHVRQHTGTSRSCVAGAAGRRRTLPEVLPSPWLRRVGRLGLSVIYTTGTTTARIAPPRPSAAPCRPR